MIIASHYEQKRLRLIADLASGQNVLDIGYAQQPNPYFGNMYRVGLDLLEPSGPVRYEEEILGDCMKVDELLRGRNFDTVVCGELIEHLENPYELLRRLHHVLDDEGRLILSTPNPMGFPVALVEFLRSRKFFYTEDHVYYFLPRWVERLCERTGYVVEKLVPVGLWTPWRALPAPVSLSYHVIYVCRRGRRPTSPS